MAKKKKEILELDPIAQILDPDDSAPVTLFDENGDPQIFDQIAVIPLDDELYAILHPTDVDDPEEVWVFAFVDIGDETCLITEQNEDVINKVFDKFEALLGEEESKK